MKKSKGAIAEEKGDKSFKKGEFKAALKHYRKAAAENPGNAAIYGKLVMALGKIDTKWTKKDFVESLDWTMKEQELRHPETRRIRTVLEALQTLKKI